MPARSVAVPRAAAWARPARHRWPLLLFCYLALAPVLALFAYIRAVPIAWSLILSFHRWDLISAVKPYVGLGNYVRLAGDANFWLALKNTTIYSLSTVIASSGIE